MTMCFCLNFSIHIGTPVCRLCGRYLAILGRPIRITVPSITVAPAALVGSLIGRPTYHTVCRGVYLLVLFIYNL